MRYQEGFEKVIEIRNQFEVVQWHKSNKLHVLNQGPERQKSNISEEKNNELEDNNSNHHVIEDHSCILHELHCGVYKE